MKKALFAKYQDIKIQIEELQAKETELKSAIIEELRNEPEQKTQNEYGKFKIAKKTTYLYSQKVQDMQEKIKLAQNREVEKGIATIKTLTEYLTWN